MKFELKKISMVDFKGVRNKSVDFKHFTQICGKNGIGKTTIATAFYWLFLDKDYELKSNPHVAPNDNRECKPTVIIDCEIDGKPIQLLKSQTIKKKIDEDTGIETVKSTNSYEINSVPKTEKAFKEYLTDLGVNFETIMYLIHPYTFMNNKTADLRSFLFGMTESKSDLEVAELIQVKEVAEMLKQYKLDEIVAMKDKELRVIVQEHGKEGELTQSKLQGLELAKVVVDVSEKEKELQEIKDKIQKLEEEKKNSSKVLDELMQEYMKLQFDVNSIKTELSKTVTDKVNEINSDIYKIETDIRNTERLIADKQSEIEYLEKTHKVEFDRKENLKADFFKAKESKFDETPYTYEKSLFDDSSTICSMCGQTLPKDDIERLKEEYEARESLKEKEVSEKCENDKKVFDQNRLNEIKRIGELGKELENKCKKYLADIEQLKAETETEKENLRVLNDQKSISEKLLLETDVPIDFSTSKEYTELNEKMCEVYGKIESLKNASDTSVFDTKLAELRNTSDRLIAEIAAADTSKNIDKQIAEFREKGKLYEQQKSNAEKILKQVKLVNKKKNEMLTDEINQHFSVVKWVLFEMQKNGEYKDACYFEIDGFRYKESTNTGREIQGILDVVYSLQKYYNSFYTVFLDGAAEINDFNIPVNDNTQLVTLNVTYDDEMVVK